MIKFGKRLENQEKRLPELVEELSFRTDILAIYLFGSRATGTSDDLSDIDIALLLKYNQVSLDIEMELIDIITSTLGTDEVSLVILNNAPLTIRYGVIKEPKVLYSADDNARLLFEESVIKQYLDFRYYLDQYDTEFISLIKTGKFHTSSSD